MVHADRHVTEAVDAGLPTHKVILGGFSQGACFSFEYENTHRGRYGSVLAFSGGPIGAPAQGHTVKADELSAAWDLVQAVAGE